ncbi:MAG: hypothetical protein ABIQ18_22865 [Umezawaea sp.]
MVITVADPAGRSQRFTCVNVDQQGELAPRRRPQGQQRPDFKVSMAKPQP